LQLASLLDMRGTGAADV